MKSSKTRGTPHFTSQSGFTLLEVIIAVAIMVVIFTAIFMVESNSLNSATKAREITTVTMLAQRAMTDAEMDFQGKTFTEVKKEDSGDFEKPYDLYSWKREIKEVEFPNIAATASANSNQGISQYQEMIGKLVTQYLSKAIREVTVTVEWQKGEGKQSFSLTQYWVDLNSEFQITQ